PGTEKSVPDALSATSSPRRRSRGQIHLQYGHVEGIGDFAVLLVLEKDADELAIDLDFHGIRLLGPFHDGDGVKTEQVAQVFFQAPDFAAGQGRFLMDWV